MKPEPLAAWKTDRQEVAVYLCHEREDLLVTATTLRSDDRGRRVADTHLSRHVSLRAILACLSAERRRELLSVLEDQAQPDGDDDEPAAWPGLHGVHRQAEGVH